MKQMRNKIFRQRLEKKLEKYGTRIQKMAEHAYKLRQALEAMDAEENKDALHTASGQSEISGGATYPGAGGVELLDNLVADTSMAERPTELPVDQ